MRGVVLLLVAVTALGTYLLFIWSTRTPESVDISQLQLLLDRFQKGKGRDWKAFYSLALYWKQLRSHVIAKVMFPWLNQSMFESWGTSQSFPEARGVVMAVAKRFVHFAKLCVLSLRRSGCQLPVVMYFARGELSQGDMASLLSLSNVRLVNLSDSFADELVQSYAAKVFAVVLSPFRETILADADAFFLHSPDHLWESHHALRKTGILLFKDMIRRNDLTRRRDWLLSVVGSPSDSMKHSFLYRGISQNDVESGVVFINKAICSSEILVIAAMNDASWRKEFWNIFHGEKETFMMGMEFCKSPFTFTQYGVGLVGSLRSNKRICGFQVAHADPMEKSRLLWWNRGLSKYKYHGNVAEVAQFQGWSLDDSHSEFLFDWNAKQLCFSYGVLNHFTVDEKRHLEGMQNEWKAMVAKVDSKCISSGPIYSLHSYSLPEGYSGNSICVADFNRDGLSDVVVASSEGITILLNGQSPTFGEHVVSIRTEQAQLHVAACGKLHFATGHSKGVSIWKGVEGGAKVEHVLDIPTEGAVTQLSSGPDHSILFVESNRLWRWSGGARLKLVMPLVQARIATGDKSFAVADGKGAQQFVHDGSPGLKWEGFVDCVAVGSIFETGKEDLVVGVGREIWIVSEARKIPLRFSWNKNVTSVFVGPEPHFVGAVYENSGSRGMVLLFSVMTHQKRFFHINEGPLQATIGSFSSPKAKELIVLCADHTLSVLQNQICSTNV